MVDNVAAPEDDRCVIGNCGRTRVEHGNFTGGMGHTFAAASQFRRPFWPHDPFQRIRKMTKEERSQTSERRRGKRDHAYRPKSGITINGQPAENFPGVEIGPGDPTLGDRVVEIEVSEIDPRNAERSNAPPPLRTRAVIVDAVERALRTLEIAPRMTIKRIEVDTQSSVEGEEILTADVRVRFGLIFSGRID